MGSGRNRHVLETRWRGGIWGWRYPSVLAIRYTFGRNESEIRCSELCSRTESLVCVCGGYQWIFKLELEPWLLALSAPENWKPLLHLLLQHHHIGPKSFYVPQRILKRASETVTTKVGSFSPLLSVKGSSTSLSFKKKKLFFSFFCLTWLWLWIMFSRRPCLIRWRF